MRVRHWVTGEEFTVVKINYMSNHPSSKTEYVLDDGRIFTSGKMWAEFVQVPEMNIKVPQQEEK